MSKSVVRRHIDLANPPPLTDAQQAELAALALRPDSEIDYSDIAPLSEDFWNHAVQGRLYKPTKTITTVRVDSDVLAWLRSQGKGYQTKMNAILRDAMLRAMQQQKA